MRTSFARFVKDESGATAIEYALIAAGIGVAILTAVNALGTSISGLFDSIGDKLDASKPSSLWRVRSLLTELDLGPVATKATASACGEKRRPSLFHSPQSSIIRA
jgi:pilus assembly protein Flp/PilA